MGKYNYNKTNWIGGKTIGTADVMNNLEEGVYQAHEKLSEVNSQLEQNMSEINEQFNTITSKLSGFYNLLSFSDKVVDNDWSIAINYALSVCDNLYIPKGNYTCKSKITIKQNKYIHGDNNYTTNLNFEGLTDTEAIEVVYSSFGTAKLENLFILCKDVGTSSNGIELKENTTNNRTPFGFYMENISVRAFNINIKFDSLSTYTLFNRVFSDQANDYNLYVVSGFTNMFTNCRFSGSKNNGVYLRAGEQNFFNCSFEGNKNYGVNCSPNGGKIDFDSCFFENLTEDTNTILLNISNPSASFKPLSVVGIKNCHFYGANTSIYLGGVEYLNVLNSSILNSLSNKEIAFNGSNTYAKNWYFKGNKITNPIVNTAHFIDGDYGMSKVLHIDFSNIPTASEKYLGYSLHTINNNKSEIRCCMKYSDGTYGWNIISTT